MTLDILYDTANTHKRHVNKELLLAVILKMLAIYQVYSVGTPAGQRIKGYHFLVHNLDYMKIIINIFFLYRNVP